MKRMGWLGAATLALAITGCMGGPPEGPPPFGDRGPQGPPRARVQLFVSPSGQPFRAPPDAAYPSAAWFAAADRNRDGRLDIGEHRADAAAWFKILDRNEDGRIDMPETTLWEEELVPEILRGGGTEVGDRSPRHGGPPGRNQLDSRRQGAGPYSLINEPHPVRGADLDVSMSVERSEWTAAADRRFRLLDRNGDGVIAAHELGLTPAQARAVADDARSGARSARPAPPPR